MLAHQKLKMLKLFVLSMIFLLAAAACVPGELFGVWVNMDSVGTTEDGVDYDRNDILFMDILTDTTATGWQLAFDGEEYGLTDKKHDLSGFSFNKLMLPFDFIISEVTETELYLSFEANRARVPGVADWIMGQDIVKFTLDTSGPEPAYTYAVFFDGSDVGLSTTAEKVDGITVWPPEYFEFTPAALVDVPYDCHAGVIFVSTRGSYRVPDNLGGFLIGDGSDVLAFCAANTGADTAGFWYRVFDGSEAGLKPRNAMSGLDVLLFDYNPSVTEDSGNSEFSAAFFFVARRAFTANGGVFGGPSELFIGGYDSAQDLHEVEGPLVDFNDGGDGPALNGVVEGISLFDFFMPSD